MQAKRITTKTTIPKVSINYNYTIEVSRQNSQIVFRDITGNDLEFLDSFLADNNQLTLEDRCCILQKFCTSNVHIKGIWNSKINCIWSAFRDHILTNYTTKMNFLRESYCLQRGRFITTHEDIPLSKFVAMIKINEEFMQQQDK